jgi:hypothetical protein
MAHFAKVDKNSMLVVEVIVVNNNILIDENGNEDVEQLGVNFLNQILGDDYLWVRTSYNTNGGRHRSGEIPFRKNYAGVGHTWDSVRDAFIPKKKSEDSTLDEETCLWITEKATLSQTRQNSQIEAGEIPHN